MTHIDDLELSQRLRGLRVAPPDTGFEARLAERLRAELPDPAPAANDRPPARVILGPWLRRGPVRLIGATALFVAGAAAAVEGGVVEWVQTRVLSAPVSAPPSSVADPARPERTSARRRRDVAPAPSTAPSAPAPPLPAPSEAAIVALPSVDPRPDVQARVPRAHIEPRRLERKTADVPRVPDHRDAESPSVPRVRIEPRPRGRGDVPDTAVGREPASGARPALARERAPDLERLRDIARARRERAAGAERPRMLDRRERRERAAAERREIQAERLRRERTNR